MGGVEDLEESRRRKSGARRSRANHALRPYSDGLVMKCTACRAAGARIKVGIRPRGLQVILRTVLCSVSYVSSILLYVFADLCCEPSLQHLSHTLHAAPHALRPPVAVSTWKPTAAV